MVFSEEERNAIIDHIVNESEFGSHERLELFKKIEQSSAAVFFPYKKMFDHYRRENRKLITIKHEDGRIESYPNDVV